MKWLRVLLMVLPLAIMVGCSSSNMGSQERAPDGELNTYLKSNNALLYSRISIVDLNQRLVGDLTQVQATLENNWKFELDFQYKIKWFDDSGFEINPEGQPWRQLILPGRNQANVQAVAPNPSATKFEIWVRE